MVEINLKHFYKGHPDEIVLVPAKILDELNRFRRYEHAQQERIRANNAYFSYEEGATEYEMLDHVPSAEDEFFRAYEEKRNEQRRQSLYEALMSLPDKQKNRVFARFFLGMNNSEIARAEDVYENAVRQSITSALKSLQKILSDF